MAGIATKPFPAQTLQAIATQAQEHVNKQYDLIIGELDKIIDAIGKKNKSEVYNKLMQDFAQIPVVQHDGSIKHKLIGTGVEAVQVSPGEIIQRYFLFWHNVHKLFPNLGQAAGHDDARTLNGDLKVLNALNPKELKYDVGEPTYSLKNKTAIKEADEIIQMSAQALRFPEIEMVPLIRDQLLKIQADCKKVRDMLHQKSSEVYNNSQSVQYPELDESFREREVSYQIEPSAIQGSGRDSRFMFQDFLRSRKLDEDSD